jgi:hypothetical protein
MKLRKKIIRKNYDRTQPKHNWLKYWRVVRYWVREVYGLHYPDLEMLLFLYSEDLFSRADFEKYEMIMSWDVMRFQKLLKDGWVRKWRESTNKQCALYTLSFKGKSLMAQVYKKLSLEKGFSEDPRYNKFFRNDAPPRSKVYRSMMEEMNRAVDAARIKDDRNKKPPTE